MTDQPEMLRPVPARPLTGAEHFEGIEATVGQFWAWGFSDLRDNTLRGVLAEFLVARTVGSDQQLRVAWDNYDVLSPSGIRIEIKSAGYLQSWSQRTHSRPVFGRLTGRSFDPDTNEFSSEREVRADVFVFAIQTCMDHAAYDVLDIRQWEFWVADAGAVRDAGTRTVGMTWVRANARGPLRLDELPAAIEDLAGGSIGEHSAASADGYSVEHRPAGYRWKERFPHAHRVAGFEGGAVYEAEGEGAFWLISDEGTLADLLNPEEDAGLIARLVKLERFAHESDRELAAEAVRQRRASADDA